MADFFTRLVERSLGLGSIVQPAIVPRFGSVPALPDQVERESAEPQANAAEPENSSLSVQSISVQALRNSSMIHPSSGSMLGENDRMQAVPLPQENLLSQSRPSLLGDRIQVGLERETSKGDTGTQAAPSSFDLATFSVRSEPSENQLFSESIKSAKEQRLTQPMRSLPVLPELNAKQIILPATRSSLFDRHTQEESSETGAPEPFRVLPPHQQKGGQQGDDRSFESRLVAAAQSEIQPNLRSMGSASERQASADSAPSSPTIRVSIGRVEVRAIMPAPPAVPSAPVRSRPAVGLDAYLKQRGSQS